MQIDNYTRKKKFDVSISESKKMLLCVENDLMPKCKHIW